MPFQPALLWSVLYLVTASNCTISRTFISSLLIWCLTPICNPSISLRLRLAVQYFFNLKTSDSFATFCFINLLPLCPDFLFTHLRFHVPSDSFSLANTLPLAPLPLCFCLATSWPGTIFPLQALPEHGWRWPYTCLRWLPLMFLP